DPGQPAGRRSDDRADIETHVVDTRRDADIASFGSKLGDRSRAGDTEQPASEPGEQEEREERSERGHRAERDGRRAEYEHAPEVHGPVIDSTRNALTAGIAPMSASDGSIPMRSAAAPPRNAPTA